MAVGKASEQLVFHQQCARHRGKQQVDAHSTISGDRQVDQRLRKNHGDKVTASNRGKMSMQPPNMMAASEPCVW